MLRWLCCCCRRTAHEPLALPESDDDEPWELPRSRPKMHGDDFIRLLVRRMQKVAKRKRLSNALFNSLCRTHANFLANFPMTGRMLPNQRRKI